MRISDPEYIVPVVHCYARCFICRNPVPIRRDKYGGLILSERNCPNCGVFLDDDEILNSFAVNLLHTSAIAAANKLISLDLATIPYILAQVLITYLGFPIWARLFNIVIYHMPIILLIRWLYRYWYRFRFIDDEYLDALKNLRTSLALWLAVNILNLILLLV